MLLSLMRASDDRSPFGDFWFEPVSARSITGARVSADAAMRMSAVYACVRVLTETFAVLPFCLYRARPDGGKERITDHWLYRLIARRPNRWQNGFEWREMLQGHLCLRGNAYNRIVADGRGRVTELIPLHPDRVRLETTGDGGYRYRLRRSDGSEEVVPRGEIWHIRGLSSDGMMGVSPIELAREAIGMGLAQQEYGARFFANDAKPSGGWIEFPGQFKDAPARNAFRESWQNAQAGANRGKVAVLEMGMKFHEIGLKNDEAQFLESRQFQVGEIARIFRVPPHMIGDLSRATFCLPGDAEVMTPVGPRRIDEIKRDDVVWSLDASGHWCRGRVSKSECTGDDPILTIRTTNRTLRANARHRVLVRRKVQTPHAGRGGYQSVSWTNEYVQAGDLKIGDTLVTLERLPATGRSATPSGRSSIGFMEFCGLLIGDGNVAKGWGVQIARAMTAQYMDHYRDVAKREFMRMERYSPMSSAVAKLAPVSLQESDRQTKFASVLAARELEQLGFCGNARTKRVPGWVFEMSEEHRLAFLRGFLDADGSVDLKGRISFSSCNEDMLSQMRHLCMSVGVPVTNLRCQRGTTTLPNGRRKSYQQYTFTCSDPGENARIGSHDPRYVQRFASGKPFGRKARKYPRYGGKGFDIAGCSLSRIASIEVGESEPVYDLEVEGTHNFVADGVVVHNSNIEHQSLEFVTHTMTPWAERWEAAIEGDLLLDDEGLEVEFDFRNLLRGDQAARSTYYGQGIVNGWLTRNEARVMEGLNPLEDLDEPLVPLNMIEVDEQEQAEQETDAQENEQPATQEIEARLAAMVRANAQRLARRAVGALAKAAPGQVFDEEFAHLVAQACAVSLERARAWCAQQADRASHGEADLAASLEELGR